MCEDTITVVWIGSAGALAVCLAGGAARASGPAVYKGKFTLTKEARWGLATLPAGDYSFMLDSQSLGGVVAVRGENQSALIMLQGSDETSSAAHSALVLTRSNGSARVVSMHLAELGKDFYFAVPKAEQQILAQGPELIQRVPIAVAGK